MIDIFKKRLKEQRRNEELTKAYLEGYLQGKKAGYLEYVQSNITLNQIRKAFELETIEKGE